MRLFISYRRADAPTASLHLAEALKLRFTPEEVFLDTRDVAAGAEWRDRLLHQVRAADVVLVVMGPHWAGVTNDHARRGMLDRASEDVLRLEVETAFMSRRTVIPVLVEGAEMPPRGTLPRPFKPLADVQARTLHHDSWDRDVEALVQELSTLEGRQPVSAIPAPPAPPRDPPGPHERTQAERIATYLGEGSVVTVLGSGAHGADRSGAWKEEAGTLPDFGELARHLGDRFRLPSHTDDLARVSEHVAVIEGRVLLCRTLRRVLVGPDVQPSSAHHFLARLPGHMRDLGRESYQLIVTTNYDAALERAFDMAHEPYELVVFVASGDHGGLFTHVPWWDPYDGGPRVIDLPNEYVGLPVTDEDELERTVIVKLHGGLADLGSDRAARDNFVVTEDDYIGYLSQRPVESVIPVQILERIRESHFLFLGHRMRDWSLRVFLQRVLGDRLDARSWAVDPGVDVLERELWEHFGVDVIDERLSPFLLQLEAELGRLA